MYSTFLLRSKTRAGTKMVEPRVFHMLDPWFKSWLRTKQHSTFVHNQDLNQGSSRSYRLSFTLTLVCKQETNHFFLTR